MQLHEALDVTKAEVGLLSEGMVASLFEIGRTELDIRSVLRLVKILANLHDLVQVVLLAIDLDGLFVLPSLHIQVCSFLPVSRVAFELGLLDQDLGVQEWLITCLILAMFANEFFSLSELFQRCIDFHRLVSHSSLHIIRRCLLELALIGKELGLEPRLI